MLHKLSKLQGYHIIATDGDAGHVDDFLVDETWTLRHLVVDTSNWPGGSAVLLAPSVVDRIDSPRKEIHVRLRREQVLSSTAVDTANIELIETLPPAFL